MKPLFGLVLSLFVLCAIASAPAQQSQEAQIAHFIENYDNAWSHKDIAMLERILAPSYVYFSSKGRVMLRRNLLDEFMSPKYNLVSAERTELKSYVTLGTAVVSSRWKGHGTFNGQEFHDDQRCSIVLARGKKDWLVLSEHCTQIAST